MALKLIKMDAAGTSVAAYYTQIHALSKITLNTVANTGTPEVSCILISYTERKKGTNKQKQTEAKKRKKNSNTQRLELLKAQWSGLILKQHFRVSFLCRKLNSVSLHKIKQ
jgi:hypothetical protein